MARMRKIDFGLGFRSALEWVQNLKETPQSNLSLINEIKKELSE